MASPVDAARADGTTGATAATSHGVAVGSLTPAAGDLVIMLIRFAAAPGAVTTRVPANPMTQLASDTSDATDDQSMVWYRLWTGVEGTTEIGVTSVNSVKSHRIAWKITGAADPATQPPEISTVAVGTTAANSANPASRSVTGGPKDVLYLAMMGLDGEAVDPTAAPTNYTNFYRGLGGGTGTGGAVATNCIVAGASRQISSSSSDDPGVFTHPAATTGWTAWTVVVHPAGAGGTTYTKAGYGRESA